MRHNINATTKPTMNRMSSLKYDSDFTWTCVTRFPDIDLELVLLFLILEKLFNLLHFVM